MVGHSTHIFPDGHFIVIEDNRDRLPAGCGIIQPLVGHTAGGSAVSQDSHHLIILPQQSSGPRHTHGNGD